MVKKRGSANMNSASGVIILEEHSLKIVLIISQILLFWKSDLDLHFLGQSIRRVCCQPQLHHYGESLVKIDRITIQI